MRHKKILLLISLIVTLLIMAGGYAIYSSQLKVTGTGSIDSNFNIEVTDITEESKKGKAVSVTEPTYTSSVATFNTKLQRPGDNIEYEVEITNNGTIDGKINTITITNPSSIAKVEVRGIIEGEVIKSGEIKNYIVRVYIEESVKITEDVTSTVEVNTEIVQDDNQIFNNGVDGVSENKLVIESTKEESEYTSIIATVNAKGNGLKYYYSLDNENWTEASTSNTYTFENLELGTRYTVYYKVEDENLNYVTESKWINTKEVDAPIITIANEKEWEESKEVTIEYPEIEGATYYYKIEEISDIDLLAMEEWRETATRVTKVTVDKKSKVYAKVEIGGNEKVSEKEITTIDNKVPTLTISTSKTSNSITIVANAEAISGISKYEYSINNGETWIDNKTYNNYTFKKLTYNTEYQMKVRITSNSRKQVVSETITIKTEEIAAVAFSITPDGELYAQEKTLTVTSKCDFCTNEYSIDNGESWNEFPSSSFDIKFLSAESLIARSSDGNNSVTSTYIVTNIDSTPSGVIKINSSETVPGGYLACDGRAVSRTTYKSLFKVIGTTYGSGDGSTTFNVPNLNGRVPVGKSPSTFSSLGETGGSINTTLTLENMPSHNHTLTATGTVKSTFTGSSATTNNTGAHTHSITTRFHNINDYLIPYGYDYGFYGSDSLKKTTSSAGDHSHTLTAKGNISNEFKGVSSTSSIVGENTAFTNLQPYIISNYIIKY